MTELIKNGKRQDDRKPEEMRDLSIEAGVLKRADGSAYLEWGSNKVIAGVFGPQKCIPQHISNPYKAILKFRYNMAPFSVDDRKRPGPDRRSTEISKVSKEALESALILRHFPNTMIEIFVEVLQAAAGTRCASLTAASVALADAGVPMKDMVAACAAGKIGDEVVLDLAKEEDNAGKADVPIAIKPKSGDIVLLQMDGDLTPEEFDEALSLAKEGCMKVSEEQQKALQEKYETEEGE